jgi:hypothetical protein
MGVSYSITRRVPTISYPISTWDAKIRFITEQIDTKGVNDNNISGLECRHTIRDGKPRITFFESQFETLSHLFKDLKGGFKSTDSFINIFQSSSPEHIFYPKTLEINESFTLRFIPASIYHNPNNNINTLTSKLSNIIKTDTNIESKIQQYAEFNEQFLEIRDLCSEGKTVCALTYFVKDGVYHAAATLFWQEDSKLVCGIYDPMYYVRDHGEFKEGYGWAIQSFAIRFITLSEYYNTSIKLMNFSELCHRTPKGIHCLQYIIDAEYCMMFSLYFIYLYASHGYPKTTAGMQSVINATFISDPAELKRNPCKATNRFRLILMSFILNAMYCLTDDPYTYRELIKIYDYVAMDGYELLDSDTHALILHGLEKNAAYFNTYTKGKETQRQHAESPNIRSVLNRYPNQQLLTHPKKILIGRKYKVIYKNNNNTVKNYNGTLTNYNNVDGFFTIKSSNNSKNFRLNNILGISQVKRRGGRQTRRN